MSTNKEAKNALERMYGKGCMFKKAGIEQKVEALRTIKTYKKFLRETKYTGRKIHLLERNLTYHHLKHRSEGGKATTENGAVIGELPHRYMHSLPRHDEEIINNMLRNYKLQISTGIMIPTDCQIDLRDATQIEIDLNTDDDVLIIPLEDDSKQPHTKKNKFNRAKTKRDTQDIIDEELQYMDDFDR